ncbi:hypothetical protein K435DRAFT_869983 [Dendrothele bispora CBS 962.96]|uniref:Uncharacterized protein n=1 Tax=Dendrothele bispora (strain CBS 962.96) TaxID=1314807 RepID=A0A4S8L7P5_DENBC|nr:hypothetical protein K435DRAFT_869983 [Dendrothele bispora CBS 962.96]
MAVSDVSRRKFGSRRAVWVVEALFEEELWIAGDVQALDKIGTSARIRSIPSSSTVSDTSPFEKGPSSTKEKYKRGQDVLRSLTTLCAGLAQVTTILEKMDRSGSGTNRRKVIGTVDRARRASVKLADSSPTSSTSLPDGVREAVLSLPSTITSTLEAVIESVRPSTFVMFRCYLTQGHRILILITNPSTFYSSFRVQPYTVSTMDPGTYNLANEYLARAVVLCDAEGSKLANSNSTTAFTSPSTSSCVTTKDKANFIRCTSGAFHDLGGTLYTSGRYSFLVGGM